MWEAGFARLVYIGEGGASPGQYRMDMIHLPKGVAVCGYERPVEDAYFVLEGCITVGWEEVRHTVEERLGPKDVIVKSGRPGSLFPQRRCGRRGIHPARRHSTGGGRPVFNRADGDTRTVWAGDAAFSYLDDQHHVIHDRAPAHPIQYPKTNPWAASQFRTRRLTSPSLRGRFATTPT